MEIITKEKRHEIYILAKEIYILEAPHTGMCVTIIKAWKGKPAFYDGLLLSDIPGYTYFVNELFPELAKIKPKRKFLNDDHYWWNLDNKKKRINKFNEIIEMTK